MRSEPERRFDPEDGETRTLQQLRELCRGKYSDAEVDHYWETRCMPVGQALHNVADDPFLTHTAAAERVHTLAQDPFLTSARPKAEASDPFLSHGPPSAMPSGRRDAASSTLSAGGVPPYSTARDVGDVRQNPFLTGSLAARPGGFAAGDVRQNPFQVHGTDGHGDVRNDPFLGHGRVASSAPRPSRSGAGDVISRSGAGDVIPDVNPYVIPGRDETGWPQDPLLRVLGPGDTSRKLMARKILVIAPWMVFLWVFFLWVVLPQFSFLACICLTVLLAMASLGMIWVWHSGKRWGPVSFLSLGLLCLLATASGMGVGLFGWHHYWRQFWWIHTGHNISGTRAATPAMSRMDAAVLHFNRYEGDAVDNTRSAGYKDDRLYCVAPILSPDTAGSAKPLVNYWAVGIDCCQQTGSFTCEDSRDYRAEQAVVMLKKGFPCPGCDHERFEKAVIKAEAVHGLVSAPGALYVLWVKTPTKVSSRLLLRGLEAAFFSAVVSYAGFWLLGGAVWYYGLGKRWSDTPLLQAAMEHAEENASTVIDAGYDYGSTHPAIAQATKPAV